MKKSRLLFTFASAMMLASCANQPAEKPLAERIVEAASKKAAIAMWADTGAVIDQTLENTAVGAHAPVFAKKFSVKVDNQFYLTNISWSGIDDVDWKQYVFDADHAVVIPSRRSAGGETLKATMVPTFSYEDKTFVGKEYKFVCEPYDVNPIDKTLQAMNSGMYGDKSVKTGDVIRTKGVVTLMSPDFSSVIVQDGEDAVQLYKSGAFSTFYTEGASVSLVGKIKDYSGTEFDPVLDVSPTEALAEPTLFDPTSANIEAFRTEWKNGSHKQANRLVHETLVVSKDPVANKGIYDTLYLKAKDGTSEIALYTKAGFAGQDGLNAISDKIALCKTGDEVTFKGALTYYGTKDLVEVNIYSPDHIRIPGDNTGPLADE